MVRHALRWIPAALVGLVLMPAAAAAEKPRLLVLTDIGGDPDDQQSMIRLMVHANEFDIEGLIATAAGVPGELKQDLVKPELIREIVEAYGKVQSNLKKHASGFPEARLLLGRIKTGNPKRGLVSVGEGKDTDGSNWIISVVDQNDARPVNITVWGGSTELAQALWKVRKERGRNAFLKFCSQIRVYDISHQDDTGPWINKEFPNLFYVLSKASPGKDKREGGYRGMYLGGDESLTSREWVDRHVCKDHGPLGALYPAATWTAPNPHATLKEGDTPSWFFFLPVGLTSPAHPEWGSWGGRFRKATDFRYEDAIDSVNGTKNARSTVSRWRKSYQNEFQARMDWCVKSPREANHPPIAGFEGLSADDVGQSIMLYPQAGESLTLDAAGSSDPDGNALEFHWWIYPEPGTFEGAVEIKNVDKLEATVLIPKAAKDKTIHVILEVTDDGSPKLTRYRRIVLNVE